MGQCLGGTQGRPSSVAVIEAGASNAARAQAGASNAARAQAGASNAARAQAGASNAAGIHQAGNNPRQLSLRAIQGGTHLFFNRIAIGGNARVYSGTINRQLVAVKRLNPGARRNEDYEREVEILTRLSHPNIIKLFGFCAHDSETRIERIVVYEYMPLRSLHDWLHARQDGEAALDWSTRMMIGAGVAKGLSYLHNEADPRVIFRDLKPADVLLDRGYHPKISDFGAALNIPPQSQNSIVNIRQSDLRMTHPYWAPEAVVGGALSPRSDVYSFGVLLLEIIIRTLPRDKKLTRFVDDRVRDPANFVGLADPELEGQFEEDELIKAMGLASLCMQRIPSARPAMRDVVRGMNNLAGEPNVEWPAEFNVAAAAE